MAWRGCSGEALFLEGQELRVVKLPPPAAGESKGAGVEPGSTEKDASCRTAVEGRTGYRIEGGHRGCDFPLAFFGPFSVMTWSAHSTNPTKDGRVAELSPEMRQIALPSASSPGAGAARIDRDSPGQESLQDVGEWRPSDGGDRIRERRSRAIDADPDPTLRMSDRPRRLTPC